MQSRIWLSLLSVLLVTSANVGANAKQHRELEGRAEKGGLQAGIEDDDPDHSAIGLQYVITALSVGGFASWSSPHKVSVVSIVKGGPADIAGLKKGDEILQLDGKAVRNLAQDEMLHLMRGLPGSKLEILIARGGNQMPLTIVRGTLGALSDKDFRKKLARSYDVDERKQRFREAQDELMMATANVKNFQGATPPLNQAELSAVIDNCNEARFAIERNQYQQGMHRLQAVIARVPSCRQARFVYALLLDSLGRFPEAESELKTLTAGDTKSLDAWLALAACERNLGKPKEALTILRKCSSLCATADQERLVHIKISKLQEELASQPTEEVSADELVSRAQELIKSGDLDDAERALRQAIAVNPHCGDAYQTLASIQQKQGDSKEALNTLKEGFASSESQDLTQMAVLDFSHLENVAPAEIQPLVDSLKQRISASPAGQDTTWMRYALARCLVKQSQYSEALDQYENLLSQVQDDKEKTAACLAGRATCQLHMGHFTDALASMEKACEASPDLAANPATATALGSLKVVIASGLKEGGAADNYLDEITRPGIQRWNLKKPLRVYIEVPAGLSSYKSTYGDKLRSAFKRWSDATDNKLRFEMVDKPHGADIVCVFTDDSTKLRDQFRAAETQLHSEGHRIKRATMTLLTVSPATKAAFSDDEVLESSMHEIGHAIGLSGHSPNVGDVMFPMSSRTQPSERDLKTLTALYDLPEPRDTSFVPTFQFMH